MPLSIMSFLVSHCINIKVQQVAIVNLYNYSGDHYIMWHHLHNASMGWGLNYSICQFKCVLYVPCIVSSFQHLLKHDAAFLVKRFFDFLAHVSNLVFGAVMSRFLVIQACLGPKQSSQNSIHFSLLCQIVCMVAYSTYSVHDTCI